MINRINPYQYSGLLMNRNLNVEKSMQQVKVQVDEYIPSRVRNTLNYPTYSKDEIKQRNMVFNDPNYVKEINLTSSDHADIERDSDIFAQKMIEQNSINIGLGEICKKYENEPSEKKKIKVLFTYLEAVNKARVPLKAKEIGQKLEDNNIKVEENEEYRISVDKTGVITVTGGNEEKAKEIENVLNDASMGWSLNQLTYYYSPRYKQNREENRNTLHEMDVEDYLRRKTNGTVSLADLSLENGKIIGLPEELDEFINMTKPNMTEDEQNQSRIWKDTIKRLLTIGIDNIPDLTTEMVYKGGNLMIY